MKVVINSCFGGFGLSPEAEQRLYDLGCTSIATPVDEYYPPSRREDEDRQFSTISFHGSLNQWREYVADRTQRRGMFLTTFTPDEKFVLNAGSVGRDDPLLVRVVEEMGEAANGMCASLRVVEIPDGVPYEIAEYDGNEHIAETHRTWS